MTDAVDNSRIGKTRSISAALSRLAYDDDRVRLAERNLAGHDCLVASRQGLFAVGRAGRVTRIAFGAFFGLRRHGDALYAFEACDRPASPTQRGRILRLDVPGTHVTDVHVIAKGIDNQCHQLAIIDGLLCVVDTAHQAVLRYELDGTFLDRRTPLPLGDGGTYHHVNSIAQVRGQVVLLLHNGAGTDRTPSELAWLDEDWAVERREPLAGYGCHDIVEDADGVVWCCGSMAGEVINSAGVRRKVTERMTRGLSVDREPLIVGASDFGARDVRDQLAGSVMFFNRRLERLGDVSLPAAPTDLIRL